MTEFTMFGYRARLILDLPDGEHNVTDCIELVVKAAPDRTGFWVNTRQLLSEIEIEKRVRSRAQ